MFTREDASVKSGLPTLAILICAALLVGCGIKPKLNDLKTPQKKAGIVVDEPLKATTIDGNQDGPEPISQVRSKRRFILDSLL